MDIREIIFKIFLDIIGTLVLYSFGMPVLVALIIAHTINMFLNGHYYVMKHNMGRIRNDPKKFVEYTEKIYMRLQKVDFMVGAAAYGSLSHNVFRTASDIDIRIFPKKGFVNWLKAIFWIFTERVRALLHSFPLDIYVFDLKVIDSKIRADEPPIIFIDPEKKLVNKYSNYITFDKFVSSFKKRYVKQE